MSNPNGPIIAQRHQNLNDRPAQSRPTEPERTQRTHQIRNITSHAQTNNSVVVAQRHQWVDRRDNTSPVPSSNTPIVPPVLGGQAMKKPSGTTQVPQGQQAALPPVGKTAKNMENLRRYFGK